MVTTRSMSKGLPVPKMSEKARRMAKKRQEAPKALFPMHLYPVLMTTLQCMDCMQLINYSFSSPQAAHNVKLLRLEVELRINLQGVYDRNSANFNPEKEQGVGVTFTKRHRETVHWWFSNAYEHDNHQELHKKIAVDGTILKKCFQKPENVIGSRTRPSQMVSHLESVEDHFRTIFRIRKTDIVMNGEKVGEYEKYLESPKQCDQLSVQSELEHDEDVELLFGSIRPKVLDYDLYTFREEMPEIVVDTVQILHPRGRILYFHVAHLNARELYLGVETTFVCWVTVETIIESWMDREEHLKCRDRLEVIRFQSKFKFNREALTTDLGAMRFDGVRRPTHYRKVVDGVTEEMDVSTGHDFRRDDGKLATIFIERGNEVAWFIVWN